MKYQVVNRLREIKDITDSGRHIFKIAGLIILDHSGNTFAINRKSLLKLGPEIKNYMLSGSYAPFIDVVKYTKKGFFYIDNEDKAVYVEFTKPDMDLNISLQRDLPHF